MRMKRLRMTMMNYDFVYHETPADILARKAGSSRISMDESQLEVLFIPTKMISVSIHASLARRKCVTKKAPVRSILPLIQLILAFP